MKKRSGGANVELINIHRTTHIWQGVVFQIDQTIKMEIGTDKNNDRLASRTSHDALSYHIRSIPGMNYKFTQTFSV